MFCNTVKSCRAAEFGLREVDLKALSYHGEVPSDERSANLERFKAGDVTYLVRQNWCSFPTREWMGGLMGRLRLHLPDFVLVLAWVGFAWIEVDVCCLGWFFRCFD